VKTKSEHRCFAGVQGFYEHDSRVGVMKLGVFMPKSDQPVPVVYYLAGLECNEQTLAMKAGAQRVAAELGLALVTADTSPRETRYPGDDASWDFGVAASFYLDATEQPWAQTYQMHSYITNDLREVVERNFPVRSDKCGIMGHSMGGHGALTIGLTHADYTSVSAIAPISSPSEVPWGQKAFRGFLGDAGWEKYDASALVRAGKRTREIRIDQGGGDKFLDTQLRPALFEQACREAGQPLSMHTHEGYDHGYYFVSTVIEAQLRHHAKHLL
jgi:S-formylglutathione hydrolase